MKNYRLHPVLPRFFALLIDFIILSISCSYLAKFMANYLSAYPFVLNLAGSLYCLFYFAIFNSHIGSGKTIGKMLCRIRVTNASSQSIAISQSFIRSAIFVLPLCFIAYLKPDAQFSIAWSVTQALLVSIVFACFYLAIFNTHSQQSLHDLLTRSQVLRNSQTYVEIKPIWNIHYYLITIISLMILISSIWQTTQHETQDFSKLDSDIQNIELNTHQMYIGDAQSIDQILVFDLKSIEKTDNLLAAMSLLQKFNDQNSDFITRNNVNKTQLNYSYHFGLIRISNSVTYDIVENRGVITLTHSGQGHSLNLGF